MDYLTAFRIGSCKTIPSDGVKLNNYDNGETGTKIIRTYESDRYIVIYFYPYERPFEIAELTDKSLFTVT